MPAKCLCDACCVLKRAASTATTAARRDRGGGAGSTMLSVQTSGAASTHSGCRCGVQLRVMVLRIFRAVGALCGVPVVGWWRWRMSECCSRSSRTAIVFKA